MKPSHTQSGAWAVRLLLALLVLFTAGVAITSCGWIGREDDAEAPAVRAFAVELGHQCMLYDTGDLHCACVSHPARHIASGVVAMDATFYEVCFITDEGALSCTASDGQHHWSTPALGATHLDFIAPLGHRACVWPVGEAGDDVACINADPGEGEAFTLEPIGVSLAGIAGVARVGGEYCAWSTTGELQCAMSTGKRGSRVVGYESDRTVHDLSRREVSANSERVCIHLRSQHGEQSSECRRVEGDGVWERAADGDTTTHDPSYAATRTEVFRVHDGKLQCRALVERGSGCAARGPGWHEVEVPEPLTHGELVELSAPRLRASKRRVCVTASNRRHACTREVESSPDDPAAPVSLRTETKRWLEFEHVAEMDGYQNVLLSVGAWDWCGRRDDGLWACRGTRRPSALCGEVTIEGDRRLSCFWGRGTEGLCAPQEPLAYACENVFDICKMTDAERYRSYTCQPWRTLADAMHGAAPRDDGEPTLAVASTRDRVCRLRAGRVTCASGRSPGDLAGGGEHAVEIDPALAGEAVIDLVSDHYETICLSTAAHHHACLGKLAFDPERGELEAPTFRHIPELDGYTRVRVSRAGTDWCGVLPDNTVECNGEPMVAGWPTWPGVSY